MKIVRRQLLGSYMAKAIATSNIFKQNLIDSNYESGAISKII